MKDDKRIITVFAQAGEKENLGELLLLRLAAALKEAGIRIHAGVKSLMAQTLRANGVQVILSSPGAGDDQVVGFGRMAEEMKDLIVEISLKVRAWSLRLA